jgi:hypothetical protein
VITVAPAGQGDRVRQNLSAIQNREFEVRAKHGLRRRYRRPSSGGRELVLPGIGSALLSRNVAWLII